MRYTGLLIGSLFFLSCTSSKNIYVPEKCIGMKEIQQTQTLSVLDTLIGFSGFTSNKTYFSSENLRKGHTFLFFKNLDEDKWQDGYMSFFNKEIPHKNLGKLASNKYVDILILNNAKIANLYGLDLKNGYKVQTNTLFIADKDKVIQKIYEDVCEEDIIRLLQEMK